ncbi:MAG: hypothetical protein P4L99_19895 [Chthoniobacter sp.]|nr:hypothetical protein [Chthoniobacter sp.]
MIPASGRDRYQKCVLEKLLLRRHFPQFDVKLVGNRLTARGTMTTEQNGSKYVIQLGLQPRNDPTVRILRPDIPVDQKVHIHSSGNLRLFDWREQKWQKGWHLHETIIPWTAEWLMFYELYLLTGKWLGKSAEHGNIDEYA